MIYDINNGSSLEPFSVTVSDDSTNSSNSSLPAGNTSYTDQSYPCQLSVPHTLELFNSKYKNILT